MPIFVLLRLAINQNTVIMEKARVTPNIIHPKSILITQPPPSAGVSPYSKLAEEYKVSIDFKPLVEVEPMSLNAIRKQRVNIPTHTAVIFTSRTTIDHFFRLCDAAKLKISPAMKYFCTTEQVLNYLHKYIVVKKRKVFAGERTSSDLINWFKKHPNENYLFPSSDVVSNTKKQLETFLKDNNYQFSEATLYKTVAKDLQDFCYKPYDILTFFTPSSVQAFSQNFPDFQQEHRKIAVFGPQTASAINDKGLRLDIAAPSPDAPSMLVALEKHLKEMGS